MATKGLNGAMDERTQRWLTEYVRRRDGSARRAGDLPLDDLRGRIAAQHAGLVESIARRFVGAGEPLDDLVQEGYLGLLSALESFDPAKRVKFSTYATHFIAGSIRHFLRDHSRVIREPAWLQELSSRIERTSAMLTARLDRAPVSGEIAQALSISETTVDETLSVRSVFQVVPFGTPGEDIGEVIDPERLAADTSQSLDWMVEHRLLLQRLIARLKTLEQSVLYEFYWRDLNQIEIARKLGISGNYVSVTLRQALMKLRKMQTEAELFDRRRGAESSILDTMTGLYTAEHLRGRLDETLSRSARANVQAAVLLLRLHQLPTGSRRDALLACCGEKLRTSVRRMDLIGRWGPDTFLLVLPDTGPQVEAVRRRLLSVLPEALAPLEPGITLTAGHAWFPLDGRTIAPLLAQAEADLGGGN